MHFAAYCYVGESVTDPLKYYFNNVAATLHLLRAMVEAGVKKFVFSSTCATYGIPASLPIVETLPQAPINPYGQTKLDVENAAQSARRSPTASVSPPFGTSTRPAPPRTAASARTTTRRPT